MVLNKYKEWLENELISDKLNVNICDNFDEIEVEKNNVYVIIKQQYGNILVNSIDVSIMLEIKCCNDDVEETLNLFTEFGKKYSKMNVNIKGNNFQQNYGLPFVTNVWNKIQFEDFVVINMLANLVITYDIIIPNKLIIDDEEINFEELNHVYEAEMISQMKASEEIAINHKSSAGFGLNILMLNFNCNFINTLQMIEMGIIEGNNVFNVKIEYSNGLNTTHKMKIKGSDFAYNKNSQPIRTIRMLKGE